jgi:hybrid cluster-associated redox disulfide protein
MAVEFRIPGRPPTAAGGIAVEIALEQRRGGHAMNYFTMEVLMPIGFDDLVHDVMNDWPATIRVFFDFKMGCVGCPIACFHTVDDACGEHHVDRDAFLKALREGVASG